MYTKTIAIAQKAQCIRGGFRGLLETEPNTLSIAIRPMNTLFTYQVVALCNGLAYLAQNPNAKLRVDLADLDFDMQRGASFVPYIFSPESERTADSISKLISMAKIIDNTIPDRVSVMKFSDWLKADADFFKYVIGLVNPQVVRKIKLLITGSVGHLRHVPFSAHCPLCLHAGTTFSNINKEWTNMSNVCKNSECTGFGKEFVAEVSIPASFSFLHIFDSVGDGYNKQTDVHLIGVDVDRPYGVKKHRISDIIASATSSIAIDNYSPKYYGFCRLDEPVGFSKRNTFELFLSQRRISLEDALVKITKLVEKFNGNTHLQIDQI